MLKRPDSKQKGRANRGWSPEVAPRSRPADQPEQRQNVKETAKEPCWECWAESGEGIQDPCSALWRGRDRLMGVQVLKATVEPSEQLECTRP